MVVVVAVWRGGGDKVTRDGRVGREGKGRGMRARV